MVSYKIQLEDIIRITRDNMLEDCKSYRMTSRHIRTVEKQATTNPLEGQPYGLMIMNLTVERNKIRRRILAKAETIIMARYSLEDLQNKAMEIEA